MKIFKCVSDNYDNYYEYWFDLRGGKGFVLIYNELSESSGLYPLPCKYGPEDYGEDDCVWSIIHDDCD